MSQTETSPAADPGSLLALHALDLSLYSESLAAMTNMHELQDQLMALVYRLSWGVKRSIQLAKSYSIFAWHPDDDAGSQTSSDDDAPEADSAAANGDAAAQQSSDDQVCPHLWT